MGKALALATEVSLTLPVGNGTVAPVSTVWYRGSTVDCAMTKRPCVNTITRCCYCRLERSMRIRRYLDDAACATVIPALTFSRLNYANTLPIGLPSLKKFATGPKYRDKVAAEDLAPFRLLTP